MAEFKARDLDLLVASSSSPEEDILDNRVG